MQADSNTKQPSFPTRQLPLRAPGIHVHDATPTEPSREDEIKRKVSAYPKLNFYFEPAQIKSWAYRHPAAVCKTDQEHNKPLSFFVNTGEGKSFLQNQSWEIS